MLAQKKINKKKLIVYFAIIGAMLLGTAFLVYKNYTLTAKNKPSGAEPPSAFNPSTESTDLPPVATPPLSSPAGKTNNIGQINIPVAGGNKAAGGLDASILDSEKFRALRDNIVESVPINKGRRDPFEPY